MGFFSRIFGNDNDKVDKKKPPKPDFGPDFKVRAEANARRVADVLAMEDAAAVKSFCAAETEIWAALLGFSRLIEKNAEIASAATLGAYWEEFAGMEAPVFAGGEWRFDPEMFFAAREHLSGDVLLHAAGRIDDARFLDFVISASEVFRLVGEEYLAAVGNPDLLKAKLFSRLENAAPDGRGSYASDDLWDLIGQQEDQRAISADLVRYSQAAGDRLSYRTDGIVGKLTETGRALCTASWLSEETTPELWRALIRQSADVDDMRMGPGMQDLDERLRELSLLPQALQADIEFGDLTSRRPVPGMNPRVAPPNPVLGVDQKWYEELCPTPDMGTGDRHWVFMAAKELIYYLSEDWEECRQGLTWGNVPSMPDFAVLLLCLERENPQVRLNAVRVLIELALVGALAPDDPGVIDRDDRYQYATVDRLAAPLAKIAGGGNTQVRRAALIAARHFPCPALAAPVSASLGWSDSFGSAIASQTVAEWIAAGRTEFHTADTLGRLPAALASWQGGPHAADALDALGWRPGNDQERIHYVGARRSRSGLEADRALTDSVLMHDVHSQLYALVENAVWLFIGLGDPDIIPQLTETLNKFGTRIMAEVYLNCGHADLYAAASDWARRHGYTIESGFGANPIGWGAL